MGGLLVRWLDQSDIIAISSLNFGLSLAVNLYLLAVPGRFDPYRSIKGRILIFSHEKVLKGSSFWLINLPKLTNDPSILQKKRKSKERTRCSASHPLLHLPARTRTTKIMKTRLLILLQLTGLKRQESNRGKPVTER